MVRLRKSLSPHTAETQTNIAQDYAEMLKFSGPVRPKRHGLVDMGRGVKWYLTTGLQSSPIILDDFLKEIPDYGNPVGLSVRGVTRFA